MEQSQGPRPSTGRLLTPLPTSPRPAPTSLQHWGDQETVVTLELGSPDGEVACVGQSLSPGKLAVEMNFLTKFSLKINETFTAGSRVHPYPVPPRPTLPRPDYLNFRLF